MKTPFVKQTGIKDCAVACLQMIIKYYNGYVNLDELRQLTKTNKDGTTAYNLIEGAKTIGFEAKGLKINDLDFDVILPCIAHVIIDEAYLHYVVIYKIDKKKRFLIIADPSDRIKKMSFDDFSDIWDNIIITLYPYKTIPLNKEYKLLSYLSQILKNNQLHFFILFFVSIFITLLSILSSFYFQTIVDNDNSKNYVLLIFIVFLVVMGIKNIMGFFRNKLMIIIGKKIDYSLISEAFIKIINLPYSYYRNKTTGELLSRISDLNIIRDFISKILSVFLVDVILSIISLITLYIFNKLIFFITIIMTIIYIIVSLIYKYLLKQHVYKLQMANADTMSYMVETITSFETVKGLGIKERVISKYKDKYHKLLKNNLLLEKTYFNNQFYKDILFDIQNSVVILIGVFLIIESKMSLGSLITIQLLLNYIIMPVYNFMDLSINYEQAKNAISRIIELQDTKLDGSLYKKIKGDIKICNLNYKYSDAIILNDINIDIKIGEKVLIMGDSGSGKSTLFKLLKKYYSSIRESIFIDDIDINDYKNTALDESIILLSQNEIIYTDTLYNNLKLDREISDQDINKILDICEVRDIIKNNQLGLNFLIEENGFNLSGGEKQRIVLARTLLSNFDILLIDEGTNEMDINLERRVLKRTFELYKNKTIICISHRKDNLDLYDHFIYLNKGRIIEDSIKNG